MSVEGRGEGGGRRQHAALQVMFALTAACTE